MIEIPYPEPTIIHPADQLDKVMFAVQKSVQDNCAAYLYVRDDSRGYITAHLSKKETLDLITALQWSLAYTEQEEHD